jgi:hypothetical protein
VIAGNNLSKNAIRKDGIFAFSEILAQRAIAAFSRWNAGARPAPELLIQLDRRPTLLYSFGLQQCNRLGILAAMQINVRFPSSGQEAQAAVKGAKAAGETDHSGDQRQ